MLNHNFLVVEPHGHSLSIPIKPSHLYMLRLTSESQHLHGAVLRPEPTARTQYNAPIYKIIR